MKKVAIITLIGNNYGNRLQNYAVQQVLRKNNCNVFTVRNNVFLNYNNYSLKNNIKYICSIIKYEFRRNGMYRINNGFFLNKRAKNFAQFNHMISFSKHKFSFNKKMNYDYYVVGSDQVWNPFFGLGDFGLLENEIDDNKKITFSASIGQDYIPNNLINKYSKYISKFKYISVREDRGKEIIEELTGRKDVEVLVDPTMLLTSEEWDKVSKKPKLFDKLNGKKYILNYFLGDLSEERKIEIERIAQENDCEIINILDKNDPFYVSGPSEFLYLEKNAFLICTDSFHSSVFAILYNRPFVVFDREQKGVENMNSRIDTLIDKFKLKNRRYNGKNITKENLEYDYTQVYTILEKERKKSDIYLKKSLKID